LESDSSFAVVWACGSLSKLINGQMVWILSRLPELSNYFVSKAIEVLKQHGISASLLIESDQRGCDHQNEEEK
jgi:lipocalin